VLWLIHALPASIALLPNQPTKYLDHILTMSKKTDSDKFKFITERTIRREKIELTKWQSNQLRAKLSRGTYWIQIADRGGISWNYTLLQHFLLNGDCPSHRALVEEYISTTVQAA
jgi:hypothetical protein